MIYSSMRTPRFCIRKSVESSVEQDIAVIPCDSLSCFYLTVSSWCRSGMYACLTVAPATAPEPNLQPGADHSRALWSANDNVTAIFLRRSPAACERLCGRTGALTEGRSQWVSSPNRLRRLENPGCRDLSSPIGGRVIVQVSIRSP